MLRVSLLLITAALQATSCCDTLAAPVRNSEPTADGRWAVFVGEQGVKCRTSNDLWVWDDAANRRSSVSPDLLELPPTPGGVYLRVVNAKNVGLQTKHWLVPNSIGRIAVTTDCKVSWMISADGSKIYSIDTDVDQEPVAAELPEMYRRQIVAFIAADNGRSVWLQFKDDGFGLRTIERVGNAIQVVAPKGIDSLPGGDYTFAPIADGSAVWIVPLDYGLWIANRTEARVAPDFKDMYVVDVHPSAGGHVGWLEGKKDEVFAVDEHGNLIKDGTANEWLPGEQMDRFWSGSDQDYASDSWPIVWIKTNTNKLFGFLVQQDGDGVYRIRRIAGAQPLMLRQTGEPLLVSAIIPFARGSKGVVVSTGTIASRNWAGIWRLRVTGDRVDLLEPLADNISDSQSLTHIYPNLLGKDRFWLEIGNRDSLEVSFDKNKTLAKSPFQSAKVNYVYEADSADRLWLFTDAGVYLSGSATSLLKSSKVQFGATTLSADDPSIGSDSTATVSFEGGTFERLRGSLSITLARDDDASALRHNELRPIAFGESSLNGSPSVDVSLLTREPLSALRKYRVTIGFSDQLASIGQMTWKDIRFSEPWYQSTVAKAAYIIVLPVVFLLIGLRRSPGLRQWVPIFVVSADTVFAWIFPLEAKVPLIDILSVGVAAATATALAALASPALFRSIMDVYPYKLLAAAALRVKLLRSRVYSEYIVDVQRALQLAREAANNEHYFSIPLATSSSNVEAMTTSITSVEDVTGYLTNPVPCMRANLLLEAPGGRGKSALLHELISRSVDAFIDNASAPIPVVVKRTAGTIVDVLDAGLGRFSLSKQVLLQQAQSGDFLLFVDGLSEQSQAGEWLAELIRSPLTGSTVRICASTRPDKQWRSLIANSDRWIVGEPKRLESNLLAGFVSNYMQTSDTSAQEAATLSVQRLSSPDGTYLPLLVRLGLLVGPNHMESIADLYAAVTDKLLANSGDESEVAALVACARTLAMETYWNRQERIFSLEQPGIEIAKMRKLLSSGLIVEVDASRSRLRETPRLARFVHDSLQSYLAACALFAANDWQGILRAAGDPAFTVAQSDIREGPGSELYDFCLVVFRPPDRLHRFLCDSLSAWAEKHAGSMSLDELRASFPDSVTELIARTHGAEISAAGFLRMALEETKKLGNADEMIELAYSQLARIVWPLQESKRSRLDGGRERIDLSAGVAITSPSLVASDASEALSMGTYSGARLG